jgi:uncharacterized protein YkwD
MSWGARGLWPSVLIAAFAALGCDGGVEAGAKDGATALSADVPTLVWPGDDAGTDDRFAEELLGLVNAWRVARGLGALTDSAGLRQAAQEYSRDMLARGYLSHLSPEGQTPGDRVTAAGLAWTVVGENLAEGYSLPRSVFEAWLTSPEHRANLEDERWTHAGAGTASDGSTRRAAALLFLRP